ncbi:hypothetical protein HDV00_005151 [Rhizophlyctis rosea]|nr:hypothetical protein HDV00_005151 [Rhizophlyctis rosea]
MRSARAARNFANTFGRHARPQASAARGRFFPTKTAAQFMAEQRCQNLFTRSQALGIMKSLKSGAASEALQVPEPESEGNFGLVTAEEDGEDDDSHIMTTLETRNRSDASQLTIEEIEQNVREAVEKHVACNTEADWRDVEFGSLSVKFRVIRDAMHACNVILSNLDMTNVVDVPGLITALQNVGKPTFNDPWDPRDPVQDMFQSTEVPANVYFVPFAVPADGIVPVYRQRVERVNGKGRKIMVVDDVTPRPKPRYPL